jgi:hypothetical protein
MQSTLPSKPTDDPCDVVMVEPDAVRVAPSDEELSVLLQQAARCRSDNKTSAGADSSASPAAPPVDTTFRPTSDNPIAGLDKRRSIAKQAARAFLTVLLAICMGLAAVAWQAYGDVATKKITHLVTRFMVVMQMPPGTSQPPAQPAAAPIQAAEAKTAAPQLPPAAQTPPEASATADDSAAQSTQLLQSMARDLGSLRQEVEQLKAGMEQLKASQQQAARHSADGSEQPKPRARMSAASPRPAAAARARRPVTPYPYSSSYSPPPVAAAPASPQATPYYAPPPSRYQQQTTAGLPADPELASAPRPPMPVR